MRNMKVKKWKAKRKTETVGESGRRVMRNEMKKENETKGNDKKLTRIMCETRSQLRIRKREEIFKPFLFDFRVSWR
jgi:hypothetical protein